jgi:drug/metabolite transporter (DMT)-like permease
MRTQPVHDKLESRSSFMNRPSPHVVAVLQALFVTFLWSTSWVLIKFGLAEIPPLYFAGLRYLLAFLCLVPFALRAEERARLRAMPGSMWGQLALLGLLMYAVTQGAQFVGLAYLPAITVSLLLSCTPIVVALLGIPMLGEPPSSRQWIGVACYMVGVLLYFIPESMVGGQTFGLVVVGIGVLGNALSSILGRSVNRTSTLPPLLVTVVSMGIGALLLVGAVATQPAPRLDGQSWAIIGWLAVANTAFAFTLWNRTLRTLSAMESSLINNTMLIQIAILAWLFLGDRPTGQEWVGLAIAAVGILLVQLRGRRS